VTLLGESSLQTLRRSLDPIAAGREMYERIERLYPICRSITGDGVRKTLRLIGEELDLQVREVPSGTRIFDWTVPQEWNIRDAYIKDRQGHRVVDFAASNLHVLNYSAPVDARLRFSELQSHLFSIPEHPDWIPYKTSYYSRNWGFCVTERQRQALAAQGDDAEYEVRIESSIDDGSLTYGECFLPGREPAEVLFSSHVCHPSLCNDNLSGISVAVSVARVLATVPRRYSYRFLFAPGTVGAIAWLAVNETRAALIRHGLVLACIGDRGNMTYKRSRRGTTDIDRAVGHVLASSGKPHRIDDFSPYGYDERQYCSPGFNLPVGVLSRTPHGRFPEYHTSADNLDLVAPEALADSLETILAIIEVLEGNARFVNTNPKCEPQLGRRGLYASLGGHGDSRAAEEAMLWVLNLSDGSHTLLDIAERAGLPFGLVRQIASTLQQHDLLREEDEQF
jgi:aminopeptidase-like protein